MIQQIDIEEDVIKFKGKVGFGYFNKDNSIECQISSNLFKENHWSVIITNEIGIHIYQREFQDISKLIYTIHILSIQYNLIRNQ